MGSFSVSVKLVLVCIFIICNFSSGYAKRPSKLRLHKSGWKNFTEISGDSRSGRILPFMAYVTFPQDQCKSDTGETGVCMKKSACALYGGKDSGTCAQGYGTCCIIQQACSEDVSIIRVNGTRLIQSPTFVELCHYEIPKQKDVCQIRLDFTDFHIDEGPLLQTESPFGDCSTDTLTISGNTNGMLGPLCGNLDGQHMYLNYGPNDKINLDLFLTKSMMQKWNIMVTMIKCNSEERAPPGCLQYFTGQRGVVKSLNYNLQHQLNNQDYAVCVRANQGMKRITWKTCGDPLDFFISKGKPFIPVPPDMGPVVGEQLEGSMCTNDWVMIFGANKYCGSVFPDSVSVMTQPFMLQVHMNEFELPPPTAPCVPPPGSNACEGGADADNDNTGFCLGYSQTPY